MSKIHFPVLWKESFFLTSTSLSLSGYVLLSAWRPKMAATHWAFCAEYYFCSSDWLKPQRWLAAWNPLWRQVKKWTLFCVHLSQYQFWGEWTFYFFIYLFIYFYFFLLPYNSILPLEIWAALSGESKLQLSHATQPIAHAGCVSVSLIHQTLTWTTWSLTCAHILMHATAHGVVQTLYTGVTESAIKVNPGRKLPCCIGKLHLCQWHAGPMLYQLSYTPIIWNTDWILCRYWWGHSMRLKLQESDTLKRNTTGKVITRGKRIFKLHLLSHIHDRGRIQCCWWLLIHSILMMSYDDWDKWSSSIQKKEIRIQAQFVAAGGAWKAKFFNCPSHKRGIIRSSGFSVGLMLIIK